MRPLLGLACTLFLSVSTVFAQTDRGTITGTVSDSTSAVIPGVSIAATHVQTSVRYETISTETGNYTIPLLPAGVYELTAELPGFRRYVRQGVTVLVAQTLRIDVILEVGATAEQITVMADAPLLRTESGDLAHNIRSDTMNSLPVLAIGPAAGSTGLRNPQVVAQLLPGTTTSGGMRINGAQGNTASYRIEGQDAGNGQVPGVQAQTNPSMDAIQEVTILTSNFSAEYGQVGGGFFNYTMKSGTNDLHGTVYDYMINEALNASHPWLGTKPRNRRHNYGFTIGGPIYIPKVYDGRDRTFFFFNWEQYRENQLINTQALTLPVEPYRAGDFRLAQTGRVLGTDPLGRPIIEGTIYDPATTRLAPDGRVIRDPFPNNTIPLDRMDPVALRVQSMMPATNRAGLTNNAIFPYPAQRISDVPALKLDHTISSRSKLSYYWSRTGTDAQYSPQFGGSDGLPLPITTAIGTFIKAPVHRLNYSHTFTPTVLFHIGVGYQQNKFSDDAPVLDYNAERDLGLTGATVHRLFPAFRSMSNAQGGMKDMGPGSNRSPMTYQKPTANTSLTWVKNNHTYKFGGELRIDGYMSTLYSNTNGIYTFSPNQTALPYLQTATTGGGTIGHPYASFLLGSPNTVRIAPVNTIRLGKHQIGFFAQDTWKVTRTVTLDYGLRWDYSTYLKEQHGRLANFSPTTPNPSAGGLPGAVIFEGFGEGRCNCDFAKNYPYAFQPRLGLAYQVLPDTVVRLGVGIVYSGTADSNGATQGGLTAFQPVQSPAFGEPVMTLRNGIPFEPPPFPNFDPGQYPQPGYVTQQAPAVWYDHNAGRPARQVQWSIGIQREIYQNLAVEVSYVGNRGVWWNSPGLIDVNGISVERLQSFGLDINNAVDRSLLLSRLNSPTAAARGFTAPYDGYPLTATVAQSLRPFPHFNSITSLWSPLGKTWYDSLQVKATKRLSNGLSFTSNFTWSKSLAMGSPSNVVVPGTGGGPVNDVFNRNTNKALSPFDQPFVFNTALNYTLPTLENVNRAVSWALRDWTIGAFVTYASGLPILAPTAQNNLNQLLLRNVGTLSYANRVPGEPLFTQDLNCGDCFDPNKEFVLNPQAWSQPAPGQFGTGAPYYSDYRFSRTPTENFAFGRTFRIGEQGVTFNIRTEFTNIFNRVQMPNPTSTNALATQTTNAQGRPTAGFGFINTNAAPVVATSRQGTIVGRLTF